MSTTQVIELRKASSAIYLACHEDVAKDVSRILKGAADEIDRLNTWADGFSDAQIKERRLCEERIQEQQRQIDKLTLALMMIREGCAEPAKFAGERLAALSSQPEVGET